MGMHASLMGIFSFPAPILMIGSSFDEPKEPLGAGKFNPMWRGPYIVKRVLEKGTYELVDYEGTTLAKPRNGLYIKKYYA